ncbi:MAG: NADH-quinone oxidoreductase subunit H [Clostridiaceae bacterium]|nr:NADH-quinone oxidoreductase subunit H [Clostridiaceae bacterium]
MQTFSYVLIQTLVVLLLAPLVNGMIKKIKAFTQKRKGAPVLQLYYDLYKLLKKTAVVSETASWIFKAAPWVVFATALAAALLAPISVRLLPAAFSGDLILLFYLLALGRFFLVLAGMDPGSTFGGMGSSREAMIAALTEPAVLVTVFTIGLFAGTTSVCGIFQAVQAAGLPLAQPMFILTGLALFIVILAETCRIPVDDPATHLELTMVHEAMILEYSGRHLALMEYGAAVKQLVLMSLWVNIFLPHDQMILLAGAAGLIISLTIYILKIALLAALVAVTETCTVKFRFFSVPNLAALAFILALIGFLQSFILGR